MKVSTLLLILLGFAVSFAQAQTTNAGSDFWLCFLENSDSLKVKLPPTQLIFITAEKNTVAIVEIAGGLPLTYPVLANQVTTVRIPFIQGLHKGDEGKAISKSVHVHSLDGTSMSVHLMSDKKYSSDATTCIPTAGLGKRYRIAGYKQFRNSPELSSEFAVVATENLTTLTIEFAPPVTTKPVTVLLNRGQVYFARAGSLKPAGSDVSGSLVSADKPIGVFSGHVCASIPANSPYCDHIVEQLLPTTLWGTLHLAVPMRGRFGDTFRIYADEDSTEVYINGALQTTLSPGSFVEQILKGEAEIYSGKPTQVIQYANSSNYDKQNGDPSMMIVPAIDLYTLGGMTFTTPVDTAKYPRNYLTVIVPKSYTSYVMLDSSTIDSAQWYGLPKYFGTVEYSRARVPVIASGHTVRWSSTPVGTDPVSMMAFQYGWSAYNAYTYPAGFSTMLLPNITCTPKSIDYGVVYKSSRRIDTIVTLHNLGGAAFELTDANFTVNAGVFKILSPKLPVTIQQDSSVAVRFRFKPSTLEYGKFSSAIMLKGSYAMQTTVPLSAFRDSVGQIAIKHNPDDIGNDSKALGSTVEILSLYPIPALTNSETTILLRVHEKIPLAIELSDVFGHISSRQEYTLGEGEHKITLPTSLLLSGTYYVRVISDRSVQTALFTVRK